MIDPSAVIAILAYEEDADAIEVCLSRNLLRLMSSASVMECGTVMVRRYGEDGVRTMNEFLVGLKVENVPISYRHAKLGINAYDRYGRGSGHPANLNMGDCFSYALAKSRNLPLLFKGSDFIHTDVRPALKPA